MGLTLKDLTVNPTGLNRETFLSNWQWLMDEPMLPMMITAMGDVFAKGRSGTVFFIDTSQGIIDKVSSDPDEFKELLRDKDFIAKRFYPGIISEMQDRGVILDQGQCYSYTQPLVLDGADEMENLDVSDISDHVSGLGQIHKQVKDLPPGTPITDIQIDY